MNLEKHILEEIHKTAKELESLTGLIPYWEDIFAGKISSEDRPGWDAYFIALEKMKPAAQRKLIDHTKKKIEELMTKIRRLGDN